MGSLSNRARALLALAGASVALAAAPAAASAQLPIPGMPGSTPAPEVANPDGKPKGTVIAIPGGSWWGIGQQVTASTLPMVGQLTDMGWKVVTIAAPPGAGGLPDMKAIVDEYVKKAGELPVCLLGAGAGGQWALSLAGIQKQIDCVMAIAAPPTLVGKLPFGDMLNGIIAQAFTPLQALALDPMKLAPKIDIPALLGYAKADSTIPVASARKLDRRLSKGTLKLLRPGSEPWAGGSKVRPADAAAFERSMKRTLRRAAR